MPDRVPVRIMTFIDREVVDNIVDKYGLDEMAAVRSYFFSETYQMLLDVETALYMDSPLIIFELWESEQITGNPRNSRYVRCL